MSFLFLYCRSGFENECAAEIQEFAAVSGIYGYCKTNPQSAYVTYHPHEASQSNDLIRNLSFSQLIFCRQWFSAFDRVDDLSTDDRITPLLKTLQLSEDSFQELFLEHLDTNEGKSLSKLCSSIEKPFVNTLKQLGLLQQNSKQKLRLHVCFISSSSAAIGFSYKSNSSEWPMGIPRLRFPKNAPSRSTLKLDEAFLTFSNIQSKLKPGMKAVDLGAAPGGWTWQLVKRSLFVTAIDNGPIQADLLETGQVEHKKEDAFKYMPKKSVDWMVCDIVDKPSRVTALIIKWLINDWCKYSVFNLKLPMKKRYLEVQKLLNEISDALHSRGLNYTMQCKQLYHDREEVTVFISLQ